MTIENALEILKWVVIILFGGLSLYFKSKAKLTEKVSGLISQAEQEYTSATKAGGMKFKWVVDRLYVYVPVWLKPLITRDVIENIVQYAFDSVESYAKTQLDKLTDKAVK